jgi:chorismate mutase
MRNQRAGSLMGLQEHRNEIERIDEQIIRLIDRRIGISKRIFEAKRAGGMPISDPERERKVLSQAMDLATELNLDAGAVKSIFEILIKMSVSKQQELQGRDQG